MEYKLGIALNSDPRFKGKNSATTTAGSKKQYERLETEAAINDQLSKMDLRDNIKTKQQMDISVISHETVE